MRARVRVSRVKGRVKGRVKVRARARVRVGVWLVVTRYACHG